MKHIFVFILSAVIIVGGLCSPKLRENLQNNLSAFKIDTAEKGVFDAFDTLTDNTEKTVISNLSYHDWAVNVYSAFNRLVGTRVVVKDDITVVRADNGYLGSMRAKADNNTLELYADNVNKLYSKAKRNGAEFLYVMAPMKGYDFLYPTNVTDYTVSNCDRFAEMIKSRNIPFLNLIETALDEEITSEEMFFVTDHHWKPSWGLWAAERISDRLDVKYDKAILDISNYNIQTYKNWFLGSQGKKVGINFTPYGADDFEVITPKFETNLTEFQPYKNSVREGDFTETVLYMNNMDVKDYYNLNPYVTYSGGDFREQIITNHKNPDGKKIVIIRDSYACALVPFLSLVMSETYVVDIRENTGYVGDKLKMSEYIEKINPDYVMVFYSGLSDSGDLFEFE
ncbi:MAG: DHHW family protein [Clostridia bacterium]|nr:DHHW family protein [Clostridia bacterium]